MRNLVPLALLFFVGCTSTSGIMSVGPDTYSIIVTSEFGHSYAKKAALEEANRFAQEQDKHVVTITEDHRQDTDFFGDRIHVYELTFLALEETDGDYRHTVPVDRDQVRLQNQTGTTTVRRETIEDPYERLLKLKELLDRGAITVEEFETEKAEILRLR